MESYSDWNTTQYINSDFSQKHKLKVPSSCCLPPITEFCGKSVSPNDIYRINGSIEQGCGPKVKSIITEQVKFITVAVGITVFIQVS